jgi:GntR family transcriptional regulator
MTILSRDTPVPLYHQVKTRILREIEAGHWRTNERLPTEDDLSARFKVSKITVRQALRELSQIGVIRREQGRGTFVQPPPVQQGPRELTSFTDEMRRHGIVASSQVLECGASTATADIAARLDIPSTEPVFRLRRLRLADGTPMGLQTACIPMSLVPGITDLSFVGVSLYDVLADRYSLYPASASETYVAVSITADDAQWLKLPAGSPAMAAERVTCLADGRRLEYVQSIMRGDRYKIVLDLVKPSGR